MPNSNTRGMIFLSVKNYGQKILLACMFLKAVFLYFTIKETRSVTTCMNIFRKNYFLFKSFIKLELNYVFTIYICSVQLKAAWNSELSNKSRCFSLLGIIYIPPIILDSCFLT